MPKKSMLPGKTRLAAKIIKMLSLIWIIPCVIIAALWIKGRIEFVYDSFEKVSIKQFLLADQSQDRLLNSADAVTMTKRYNW